MDGVGDASGTLQGDVVQKHGSFLSVASGGCRESTYPGSNLEQKEKTSKQVTAGRSRDGMLVDGVSSLQLELMFKEGYANSAEKVTLS